ncbi:PEP-CTERM sorting domain-containing protein [Massilia sp. P8910]|uniref:PEP-CTERM sorting domain-containing protein n=1 Tax=Massilia antarctica TaxID=2765360 RepID=UPI0006BB8688|nr:MULTISPECIES: PEP-CTERM sorting domain-containing protein [Massilia]MCE3602702.1 PEP-CTERM sorting domain-containing protein [Massilia antarctica]MCY0916397.1 PEP-CTERM sorting domain-containing protein [Massilia sp. H27-R4]CUI07211.1 hypothetical protein BN2497_9199 [Janthinobacterium sp. CG23_2]CUU30997.1 hypothetical protein BN3177_9199 [Janthinobacterium sp. CG23_2]
MLKQTRMFGLICVLVSGAASAQMTATVTISNFSYQLIDLNPNDGVAPSLSWQVLVPELPYPNSVASVRGGNLQTRDGVVVDGTGPLDPVSVSKATLYGGGSASVTGEFGKNLTLHTSLTSAPEAPGTKEPWRWDAEAATGWMPFILTPNTAVIFSAGVSGGGTPGAYHNFSQVGLGARSDIGGKEEDTWAGENWYATSGPTFLTRLELTVSNSHTYSTTNAWIADAMSSVFNTTSPVPEPSSWVMLLAGLGIAGFASRRGSRTRR